MVLMQGKIGALSASFSCQASRRLLWPQAQSEGASITDFCVGLVLGQRRYTIVVQHVGTEFNTEDYSHKGFQLVCYVVESLAVNLPFA